MATSKIYLANTGNYTKVSPEHFEILNKDEWTEGDDGYVIRNKPPADKTHKSTHLRLGRIVMEMVLGRLLTDEEMAEHINRRPLDNRIENLRLCSYSQNNRNRSKTTSIKRTSDFLGIDWHEQSKMWRARLQLNKEPLFIGLFNDEIDAARMYNKFAKMYHDNLDGFVSYNKIPKRVKNNNRLLLQLE